MVGKLRKYHGDGFKFKVALVASRGNKSAAEMSQEFGVASSQIYSWKKHLEDNGAKVFSDKRSVDNKDDETARLYAAIGRLTIERDLLMSRLDRSK